MPGESPQCPTCGSAIVSRRNGREDGGWCGDDWHGEAPVPSYLPGESLPACPADSSCYLLDVEQPDPVHPFRGHEGAPCLIRFGERYCDRPADDEVHTYPPAPDRRYVPIEPHKSQLGPLPQRTPGAVRPGTFCAVPVGPQPHVPCGSMIRDGECVMFGHKQQGDAS